MKTTAPKVFFKHFLILLLIFCFSKMSFSKTLEMGNLSIDLSKEAIEKFPTLGTSNPTLNDLDQFLRFLMSKGIFENLQIIEYDNTLKLDYRILKNIKQISYIGLNFFDSRELNQTAAIESGQKFDSRILNEIQEKIVNFYNEQGFLNTKVNVTYIDSTDNTVDLNIKVDENEPLKINAIFIESKNKELVTNLNRNIKKNVGRIYNPQIIAAIPKQIQDYLRYNNFIRAGIQNPETHMNSSKTLIDLTYHLERTEQYSIVFEGNYSYPTPRLLSAIEFNSLSSASPNILAELTNKIKEFYWKKGYSRVEIKGEEKIAVTDVKSTLLFQINEGNQVKIDSIEILGNFSRPAQFYQKFLKNHSGDTISDGYFHRNDFELGLKNLIIDLQNAGYLKAKLISSRYNYNKTKDIKSISL